MHASSAEHRVAPSVLFLLLGASPGMATSLSPAARVQESEQPAAALFIKNCASCHGETGDGKGWTELDRPARSFRDGGFSYGNTPKAIVRTLTTGIPGTPMPSFEGSVSAEEMRMLAEYVITLGPPVTRVERSDTIIELGERPVIVRGMLPPIAAGASVHTRGLLIGMPSGMSFEYRIDDVRLLGLRQGEFCERTDWVGRGGTELKPLGQVVHLMGGGDPQPLFHQGGEALQARMRGSWIDGTDAGVRYRLENATGERLAIVRESVRAVSAGVATGFQRSVWLDWIGKGEIDLREPHRGEGKLIGFFPIDEVDWLILRRKDGFYECRGFRVYDGAQKEMGSLERIELRFTSASGAASGATITTLVSPSWSPEVRTELSKVVSR